MELRGIEPLCKQCHCFILPLNDSPVGIEGTCPPIGFTAPLGAGVPSYFYLPTPAVYLRMTINRSRLFYPRIVDKINLVEPRGIEPLSTQCKCIVLPLNDGPVTRCHAYSPYDSPFGNLSGPFRGQICVAVCI